MFKVSNLGPSYCKIRDVAVSNSNSGQKNIGNISMTKHPHPRQEAGFSSNHELPKKKKVKKNNPETEAYYSLDHSCFEARVTTSSLNTDALFLPQDFTSSDGLKRTCLKKYSPKPTMSSNSSREKRFVTFTLAPVDVRHCRLRLPMQFSRENGINKPGKIYLLGNDGSKWLANLLLESRGRMTVGDGWKSFVKANGLKTGESYTLELNWEDTTPVLSLCPAEYSINSRAVGECSETSEKESLPIKPSSGNEIIKYENSKEESSSWEREKNHLRWRDSTSASQNRFLTLTITPDSLRHGRLRLPMEFMTENGMNMPGDITLLGKDGARWLASLLLERRGRMCLGKGWKDFAKANGLKTGDSITLESVWEDSTPVLSLLRIESSSDRGQQGEYSKATEKESVFTEPSSGNNTRKAERNKEESKKYPLRRRDSSLAIQSQSATPTLSPEIVRGVAHDLRIGEIVVFRYEGDMMFHVSDLRPSFCEIRDVLAPSSNSDQESRGRMTLGDGWKSFVKANGLKTDESFALKLNWEETTPVLSLCPAEYSIDSRDGGGCSEASEREPLPIEPSSGKEISKDENNEDENSEEESSSCGREKNHLIWRDSTSPSRNRFLTLAITPDSLRHGRLRLPLQFMRENSMNKPGDITLLGKDGVKWLVSLLLEKRGRMSLGKGWKYFAKANGLKTGDSITLESIWEDATPVLSLLRVESSNDKEQSEFSNQSLFTGPSSGNKTRKTENNRKGSSSWELEKTRDLSSAIQNRVVILTLTPEDIRDCKMHLPSQFMRTNGIIKPGKITLLGRTGMKWFAYLLSKDGTVALGNGWKGFCEANGVMVGESFILEFITREDTNHVLKFYSNFGDQIHKC